MGDGPVRADVREVVRDHEADIEGADDGAVVQPARGMPCPRMPSAAEVEKHNLNHLPYRDWCPHCVAARRRNQPHLRTRDDRARAVPCLHLDYCFVRDSSDEENVTVLVGKLEPSMNFFACPCDSKGRDPYAVQRLEEWMRSQGLDKFVYRCDQELPLKAMVEEALVQLRRSADHRPREIPPEHSAVGESQSNGVIERAVPKFEDQLRTIKSAFESRVKTRIASPSPIMAWMIEHVANLLNKYTVNDSGVTPFEDSHGRRAHDRAVEFGERVFYYVPKKLRSKLDLRWRLGVYLGASPCSN